MDFAVKLQEKIDRKTKPIGALGQLERVAKQIALVQQTLTPQLSNPHLVVFAGDHGVAQAGVSAYPPEVTYQMVINMLHGGAAINVMCRQFDIETWVVDAGVNRTFGEIEGLISKKVAYGTNNFLEGPAMSREQANRCFHHAAEIVDQLAVKRCNVVGFGEMGIGNSSSASLLMHYLTQLPLDQCVGRGTGLNDQQLEHKYQILLSAAQFHGGLQDPMQILQTFGGLEIAQMTGAMLRAFHLRMLILVDGFIASSAYLVAQALEPRIREHAIFCHLSQESGHQKLLNYLGAEPVLRMDMRLGEGVGCALAFPILKGAVAFLNEMASFDSAKISDKPA